MPSVSRATTIRRDVTGREPATAALQRRVEPAGKRGSKLRHATRTSVTIPGQDLSTRLRVFQREWRGVHADEELDMHSTAPVGVATLPEAATKPDGLIQSADMAMCRVKQSGRNGIQAAIAPTES
jgi:GGDEF domain-containing protein